MGIDIDAILENKSNKQSEKETAIVENIVTETDKQDDVKDIDIDKENVTKDNKVIDEDDNKKLSNLEKALNDTKKTYQKVNQINVIAKKKLDAIVNKFIDEDSLLDEEIEALKSIFTEEVDVEKDESKSKPSEDNVKTIIDKLDKELISYKKYNKDKNADDNYVAFFNSVSLLNVEERKNLMEYLDTANPEDGLEKVMLIGSDYNKFFGEGLKKHKNVFSYVENLHSEIEKLNEEINNYKTNVDNQYDKSDNKQIKHRSSPTNENKKRGDDLLSYILANK